VKGAALAIELRHLRYFLAVIDELHFGRAAERLHMAQPPLSQAIRRLESELGVQLLYRTSRVVTPTKAGRVFAEHAREILAGFDLAVSSARRMGDDGATVRVGCSPSQPMEELGRFLQALRDRVPSLELSVQDLLVGDQIRLLRSRELALGIFPGVGEVEGIEAAPLFPGELMAAFLSADHALASREVLGPTDLRDETLVVIPEVLLTREYRDRYLARVASAGYRFADVHEAGGASPRELLLPVAAGLGVALHRASLGATSGASGAVVRRPLDPPLPLPETVLAWSANPAQELLYVIAAAREVARELGRDVRPVAGMEAR